MNKEIKLNKGEQRQTDILAKRVMPKTDFKKVIEHDKLYWNTLNKVFEFSVIKADILSKTATQVIANKSREDLIKNIDLLVDWAKTELEVLDLKGKMKIQESLIEDKEIHFENVFMPQYNKETEQMKGDFEPTLKLSKERLSEIKKGKYDKRLDEFGRKINYELEWWKKVDSVDKNNEEFKLQIWKPLKRLLGAYDKKMEEIKQEEKYKV